jgi:hypothetical protein
VELQASADHEIPTIVRHSILRRLREHNNRIGAMRTRQLLPNVACQATWPGFASGNRARRSGKFIRARCCGRSFFGNRIAFSVASARTARCPHDKSLLLDSAREKFALRQCRMGREPGRARRPQGPNVQNRLLVDQLGNSVQLSAVINKQGRQQVRSLARRRSVAYSDAKRIASNPAKDWLLTGWTSPWNGHCRGQFPYARSVGAVDTRSAEAKRRMVPRGSVIPAATALV